MWNQLSHACKWIDGSIRWMGGENAMVRLHCLASWPILTFRLLYLLFFAKLRFSSMLHATSIIRFFACSITCWLLAEIKYDKDTGKRLLN
uniref:Uncharacterized protein n=1 Tax=Arundo donax TaxID=35708 RepID=A0A0A9HAZ4_ARUDO